MMNAVNFAKRRKSISVNRSVRWDSNENLEKLVDSTRYGTAAARELRRRSANGKRA